MTQTRRLAIVAHFDKHGRLGGYVEHFAAALREQVERMVLVVNGDLLADDLARAEALFDVVTLRPNTGFDVYAFRDGLAQEADAVASVDEVVLCNTTFYGPIHDLGPVLARAEAMDVDFWGITDHAEIRPNPLTHGPVMERHIQSYWLAVRRRMLDSKAWRSYWDDMPDIVTYDDAVLQNEVRFTGYFAKAGFRWDVLFPVATFGVSNATMEAPDLLLDAGCPFVKRRVFFHDPLHFEVHAIIGRDVMDRIEASGYPVEHIWADVAHVAMPRRVHTSMSLLEVLPDVPVPGPDVEGLRVGVLAHIFYEDMADEMLDMFDRIPGGYTLIATTATEAKRDAIQATLERRGRTGDEVRVVASNRGRDISAFLLGCEDVLQGDRFDVILKVHSKKSPQAGSNRARIFQSHLFENLLHTPGYVENVLRLFVEQPTMGMAFPPLIHIGYPTLGRAWFTNKQPAQELADRLGIRVRFDEGSPVAAFGSMFWARPEALRSLVDVGIDWSDYPDEGGYADGTLAHVMERMFAYAAIDRGYHVRTIMTTKKASSSHTSLEYKLQEAVEYAPGELIEQLHYIRTQLAAPGSSVRVGLRMAAHGLARRDDAPAKLASFFVRRAAQVWKVSQRVRRRR